VTTPTTGDPSERAAGPTGRYSREAALLALQAPTAGAPRSSAMDTVTDPLLPPATAAGRLDHFWPGLYDLRAETHLARLLKVLLGEAGAGMLRKRYLGARMGSVISTMRYSDLDRFFGQVLGLSRLSREALDTAPYLDDHTSEEWDEIDARDASYRSRVELFARAVALGATAEGMAAAAEAVVGVPCRVYESWRLVDVGGGNPGGAPPPAGGRTYGEVGAAYPTYGDAESGTYADLEAGSGDFGRTTTNNRGEFIVRPTRLISQEESYALVRVLSRLKPAGALLTVDPRGVAVHSRAEVRDVAADSTYWEVTARVAPTKAAAGLYPRPGAGQPVPQPAPAGARYQGEAWSYNADARSVTAYQESATGARVSDVDHQVYVGADGRRVALTPALALADPSTVLAGRAVSDGVLVGPLYDPART
jgi:hypothetical protein